MGVIMVFGIIGLGLLSPIVVPLAIVNEIATSMYWTVRNFFEELKF